MPAVDSDGRLQDPCRCEATVELLGESLFVFRLHPGLGFAGASNVSPVLP